MRSLSVGQSSNRSNLRILIENGCLASPSTLNDEDEPFFPRSFSYHKLPPQLLKLSVLKLDGSSFDVNVGKNTTVGEVKEAIEEVFIMSPKEDQGNISWSHVWGHFCLSYEGHKLLNDKEFIQILGIKDGDQLKFIQHISVTYSPSKRQSKKDYRQNSMSSSQSNVYEEIKQTDPDDIDDNENQEDNFNHYHRYEGEDEQVPLPEFKLANFLRNWLSKSRLCAVSRKRSEGRSQYSSRFAKHCLGGRARMIQLNN